MNLRDIHIRDPYILLESGKYYLYGTRFNGEKGMYPQLSDGKYVEAASYSENGVKGPWKHYDELLYKQDGGHGMLFRDKSGQLLFTMHYPNTNDLERPVIVRVVEQNGTIEII